MASLGIFFSAPNTTFTVESISNEDNITWDAVEPQPETGKWVYYDDLSARVEPPWTIRYTVQAGADSKRKMDQTLEVAADSLAYAITKGDQTVTGVAPSVT